MSNVIRDATRGDAAVITDIIRAAFADVAKRFRVTSENCPRHPSNCKLDWIETAMEKGVRFYVLERSGTPIGCVALEFPDKPGVCYLEPPGCIAAVSPSRIREALGGSL